MIENKKIHTLKWFALAVVFSMLLHWGHSYVHFFTDSVAFETKKEATTYKANIQTASTISEVCHICDFYFGDFSELSLEIFSFQKKETTNFFTSFYKNKKISFFKGSFFCLRAPPLF